jgi:hypothetical protein
MYNEMVMLIKKALKRLVQITIVIVFQFTSLGVANAFTLKEQGLIGWSVKHLVVTINYSSCPIDSLMLERAVDHAFELWNAVSTSNIHLVRGISTATDANTAFAGTATDSPVIVCDTALSAKLASGDSNNVSGLAKIIQSSGTIVYGTLLLNAEAGKAARVQTLTSQQLEIVIAHELGHLLGLGHSSDETSLMHHAYTQKNHMRLSQDDIDGITYLYARVEPDEDKVFGCSSVQASGSSGGTTGVQYAMLILLCLLSTLWLRRPVSN